jgi:hypothetical protein
MASIDVTDSDLIIHMEGHEHLFLFFFKKDMTIPLEHVLGADYDPQAAKDWYHGPKIFGTGVPGRGTYGVYYGAPESGDMGVTLWDVADPNNAIVIRLSHEHYKSIVVGVDNPRATVQAIQNAVAARAPGS